MGFRFRKSIKVLPGVKVNLSKSGVSTSAGVRGGTVNVGTRGVRVTASLPGSGLSHSQQLSSGNGKGRKQKSKKGCGCLGMVTLLVVAFAALGSTVVMLA
jgi:hypothetical protein